MTPPPTQPAPRLRRWLAAPLFWLVGSTLTHVSAAVLVLMGGGAAALAGGEGGVRGGGDTNIDISVAGSDGSEIAPPPVDPAPPAPVTPPPPKVHPQVAPPPQTPPDPDSDPSPPVDMPRPRAQSATAGGAEKNGGRAPGPVRLGGMTDGPRGDTIEGQRSLLPSAATCKDPVEGVWESLKFNPFPSSWVRFTLIVHRGAGGVLSGSILSHTWYGSAFDRTPPECSPRGFEMSVSMKASGHVTQAAHINFGASAYTVVANQCPTGHADYAPDNFSGTIDAVRQEFQSVNNDGFVDINAPYVFRRTGCLDD